MKKYSLLFVIILIVLLMGLCACGQRSGSTPVATTAPAPTEAITKPNDTTTTSPEPMQPTEQNGAKQEAQEPSPTDIYESKTFTIVSGGTFDGGVAWATLYNEKANETFEGIINTYGELIYKLEEDRVPGSDQIVTLPFSNGLSVVYRTQSGVAQYSCPGFMVLSDAGEEIFTCTDENIYLSGATSDGKIIALRHESGFAGDNWYFCIFDRESLSLQETGIKGSDKEYSTYPAELIQNKGYPQFLFLADGLYYNAAANKFLNLTNKSWFEPLYDLSYPNLRTMRYRGRANEKVFFEIMYPNLVQGYLPVDMLQSVSGSEELWTLTQSDSFIKISDFASDLTSIKEWRGGSLLIDKSTSPPLRYTDLNGNTIFTFPSFPEGVKYKRVDDFSGGYAALYLIGVDQKGYVTIIDEDGNVQYDPVRCDAFSKYTDADKISCTSLNGYIFIYQRGNEPIIINPDGHSLKIGDDLSGLNGTKVYGNDFMYAGNTDYPGYVSLNGKTRIDSIIANFNKAGQLLYTDKTGVLTFNANAGGKTFSPEPITSNEPEKEYAFLSSFTIEGKWKNVGTGTYGQVQSGAIVAFDGTHCNVVSPQDTYAFYKNGDNWRLDCTTLLGDTLSFTVKTVDEDNIDIYFGSSYLEMTRID